MSDWGGVGSRVLATNGEGAFGGGGGGTEANPAVEVRGDPYLNPS